MHFWSSAEVHQPAGDAFFRVRKCVEPFLNAALAESSLAGIEGKLRYVPIIMPKDMHARYTERSKLRRKERVYDCAPHLDYDLFVNGELGDQLREFLRGIALAAPHLTGLGATEEQIEEFKAILEGAVERILVERPDQTRH